MTEEASKQKRRTGEMAHILGMHAITIDDQVIEKIDKENQTERPVFSLSFCVDLAEEYESIIDYYINRYERGRLEKANQQT